MPRPLTKPMAECLALTIEHGGKLIRHPGGHWSWPECPRYCGFPTTDFGSTTVTALVTRGELEYSEWATGRNGSFPIAAQVKKAATNG